MLSTRRESIRFSSCFEDVGGAAESIQAAYEKYSEAIKEDPENAVLYANRAATSLSMKESVGAAWDVLDSNIHADSSTLPVMLRRWFEFVAAQ